MAPTTPVVSLLTDTGTPPAGSASDKITSVETLNVTPEASALVEYKVGTGAWTTTAPTGLAEGTQTVLVRQTDLVGNVSSTNTFTFTLDKTVAAPTVALANDTGSSSTDKNTFDPTLSVSGETGAQVQYSIDSGTTWVNSMPTLTDGAKAIKVRQHDI